MTTKEIYDLIYASKRGEETYNNILKVVEHMPRVSATQHSFDFEK